MRAAAPGSASVGGAKIAVMIGIAAAGAALDFAQLSRAQRCPDMALSLVIYNH